jgi:hypothetical protein
MADDAIRPAGTPPVDSVAAVRALLLETFGDYHARITTQVALVDRLIAAVQREAAAGSERQELTE